MFWGHATFFFSILAVGGFLAISSELTKKHSFEHVVPASSPAIPVIPDRQSAALNAWLAMSSQLTPNHKIKQPLPADSTVSDGSANRDFIVKPGHLHGAPAFQ
jgi:hypothetical protein